MHDRLQIEFRAARARHAMIVSVDGRGAVTLHYPDRADSPTAVKPGQLRLLEKSYILDDAPRYERFFLLLSDTPIQPGRILAHLNRLAARGSRFASLARVPGLAMKQLSLLLYKETP